MEDNQFQKIQGWFETLDRKFESLDRKVEKGFEQVDRRMSDFVTKQQFENRFQALMTAIMNLHERVEAYKGEQNLEILILKRAIHDLEEEIKTLRPR